MSKSANASGTPAQALSATFLAQMHTADMDVFRDTMKKIKSSSEMDRHVFRTKTLFASRLDRNDEFNVLS